MHNFDFFEEHLEVARWLNQTKGSRDAMMSCPSCGSRDNLHVTEKNGKALTRCFGCNVPYNDLVKALEEAPEPTEEESEATPVVTITRSKRQRPQRATAPEPAAPAVDDPLEWYAQYCQVDRSWLESLGVSATADGWLAHTWPSAPGISKDRQPAGRERRWTPKGATPPRLWPQVSDPLPEEIWLCEGETDAIVLRLGYNIEAYTAGSATTLLTVAELKALKRRGVTRIVVAYDNDKEGHKATEAVLEACREAGIGAVSAVLGDPFLGGPKDWRERWTSGDTSKPLTSSEHSKAEVWRLEDVEPAEYTGLLLGRLHPSDHTILFGDGGTGKGVIASWWAALLSTGSYYDPATDSVRRSHDREPMNVLVLDYEAHAKHEWRPRVEGFRGDLTKVFVWQPEEPIWNISGQAAAICREYQIDYVIIDSVTYACAGEEVEKSGTAAKYSLAIAEIRKPVLSLAHRTKQDEGKYPFGSVFWHNGARVTISVTAESSDGPRTLKNKKTNQAAPFHDIEIPWDWVHNEGTPERLKEKEKTPDISDALIDILKEHQGPMMVGDIDNELMRRGIEHTNPSAVLSRRKDLFTKGSKRGEWALQEGPKVTFSKRSEGS